MAKVLKITKHDKTVHVMPLTNKSFYEAYNRRQKSDKKWKIEVIDEAEAKDLPFVDETHITPLEAVKKAGEQAKTIQEQAAEIEELKKQLAAKETAAEAPVITLPTDIKKTTLTSDELGKLNKADLQAEYIKVFTEAPEDAWTKAMLIEKLLGGPAAQ